MTTRQWRTSLIILLCVSVKANAFSNPSFPLHQLSRGGDTVEEDQQIDEYIESLIATVDSSSESSSEDVRDDIEVEGIVESGLEVVDSEGEGGEVNVVIRAHANDSEDEEHEKVAAQDSLDEAAVDEEEEAEDGGVNVETENDADFDAREKPSSRKKRRKKSLPNSAEEVLEEPSAEESDVGTKEETPPPAQALGPARPNAIYRFLLNQGRIGHILVLICVLIAEFIQTYIPPLSNLLAIIFSVFSSSDQAGDERSYRQGGPKGPAQKVNAQYAAFVSSDGTTVRGKQRKKLVKKADEQAAEKLRRIGSIQDAKFRHVSQDFMKRHRIGSFRDMEQNEEVVIYGERNAIVKTPDEDDEEESDVDWVVAALSKEDEEKEEEYSSPIETSFGVGLGSDGASISVGVEFGSSKSSKKKKRRKTLAEAATERAPTPKKKPAGPRTSDRDGGGGVIGRIRAAGANSLVSRSLLGAYPGDAVSPSEAGSPNGVIALAEKYGYGDWSDDEENGEDFSFGSSGRKVKKKRVSKKRKTRKPSSSSGGGGVSIQFGLSSSGSTRSRTPSTPKRPSSARRKKETPKDPVPTTEKSDILTGRPASSLPERRRVEVRPPTEKLNLAMEKAKRRRDED